MPTSTFPVVTNAVVGFVNLNVFVVTFEAFVVCWKVVAVDTEKLLRVTVSAINSTACNFASSNTTVPDIYYLRRRLLNV